MEQDHARHHHHPEPGTSTSHDFVEANKTHHNSHGHAHSYAASPLNDWAAEKCASTILRLYPFDEDSTSLLDFACGPGLVSQRLAEHCKRVVGVDLSIAMVEQFNKTVDNQGIDPSEMIAFQRDVLEDDPTELNGELFDIAICSQAYHHIPDINSTTKALARRLKPGGVLMILDMDSESDFGLVLASKAGKKVDQVVAHKGGFSKEELTTNLENSDMFSDISVEISHTMKLSEMKALKGRSNWATGIESAKDYEIRVLVVKGVRKAEA